MYYAKHESRQEGRKEGRSNAFSAGLAKIVSYCAVAGVITIIASTAVAQRPSIALFENIIDKREVVEYSDLKDKQIGFGKDNRKTTGFSAKTVELTPTVGQFKYDPPETAIHMEAKADAKDDEYGIEARRRIVLPKGRRYQLQGGGRISDGVNQGADIQVLVRSVVENGKGEVLKTYNGMPFFNQEFDQNWKSFVADLSEFAGQEIELVLSLKVKPKYTKIGDTEMLSPERISADWTEMKIVDSSFRVVSGESEKVSQQSTRSAKTSSMRSSVSTRGWDYTYLTLGTEYCALEGKPDRDWDLNNPGESGVNTVKIPGSPSWFAAYFTSQIYTTPESYYAYPCMFDFSSNTSYNMYNTSYSTIKNYVKRSAGDVAENVISPNAKYDNDWPNHVAIASATMGKIDGNGSDVVNAFAHREDVCRATAGTQVEYGVYSSINFATSSGANIGKSFTKMTTKDSSNNDISPIIEYELTESALYNSGYMSDKMFGCGSPSIIEKDGYYYMIYHTRALRPKVDWWDHTGTDRYRIVSGFYTPWNSITIARASVSDVNSSTYSINTNPWHKYYELASAGQEWTQEDGVGGKASILWNSWKHPVSKKRSEFVADSTWRAYPKVSYNLWAADYVDVGDYMMICQGKTSSYADCVLIHNSTNVIDWSDEGIIVDYNTDIDFVNKTGVKRVYPTLIGDNGHSTETTESNMMYYQKDYFIGDPKVYQMDLYRRSLRFEK